MNSRSGRGKVASPFGFKFSVRVPVTVHIRCFVYRHVCGSLVDLLHSLLC